MEYKGVDYGVYRHDIEVEVMEDLELCDVNEDNFILKLKPKDNNYKLKPARDVFSAFLWSYNDTIGEFIIDEVLDCNSNNEYKVRVCHMSSDRKVNKIKINKGRVLEFSKYYENK
jgi:hypothetical protein